MGSTNQCMTSLAAFCDAVEKVSVKHGFGATFGALLQARRAADTEEIEETQYVLQALLGSKKEQWLIKQQHDASEYLEDFLHGLREECFGKALNPVQDQFSLQRRCFRSR